MRYFAIILTALCLSTIHVAAEPRAAKDAVQEISALNADMTHFATILRLSEDIAFWQSVSIMGAEYNWEFNYDAQGALVVAWTYRLYNTLDETLLEGIRASQEIARSRVLRDEDKIAGKSLFAQYEEMRAHGASVHRLLKAGKISEASEIYEEKVIQLRRDISMSATSTTLHLSDRIKRIALDVRMGK